MEDTRPAVSCHYVAPSHHKSCPAVSMIPSERGEEVTTIIPLEKVHRTLTKAFVID